MMSFLSPSSYSNNSISNSFIPLTPPTINNSTHNSDNPILDECVRVNNSFRRSVIIIDKKHYIIELFTCFLFISLEKLLIYTNKTNSNEILTLFRLLLYTTINTDIYMNNIDIIITIFSSIYHNTGKLFLIIFLLIQFTISVINDLIYYNISNDYLDKLDILVPLTLKDYILFALTNVLFYLIFSLIITKNNYTEIKIFNIIVLNYVSNSIIYLIKIHNLFSYLVIKYIYNMEIDYNIFILFSTFALGFIIMLIVMSLRISYEII